MGSVKDNLIAARALIDTPEKWGKGVGGISPSRGTCALGACGDVGLWGVPLLAPHLPDQRYAVHTYNDAPTTTHADIMALFDRAIAAAEVAEAAHAHHATTGQ